MSNNAPYAYEGLNRIIHERARLAILTSLIAAQSPLNFHDLKKACGLTDGNLSRHLQVLQEADLITIEKSFKGNRPLTTLSLTAEGRARFLEYITTLEQVVKDAAAAQKSKKPTLLQKLKPQQG